MTFYVPGPSRNRLNDCSLYLPFPLLFAIEYTGGICDFYEFLEVKYRLKISPIDKTYSGDRIF